MCSAIDMVGFCRCRPNERPYSTMWGGPRVEFTPGLGFAATTAPAHRHAGWVTVPVKTRTNATRAPGLSREPSFQTPRRRTVALTLACVGACDAPSVV